MKRKIAALLCIALLFSAAFCAVPLPIARAATRQELEDELERIDGEIENNKSRLSELKGKKEAQQEYLDTLKSQIDAN